MKFAITVITIVLMVRGCCCAVVSYNNFTTSSSGNNKNESSSSVAKSHGNSLTMRATSTTTNSSNSEDEENENPFQNMIQCFRGDSLFKCFNERVGVLIKVWREALLNSVRRDSGGNSLKLNQSFEYVLRDLGKAIYYGFTSFFFNKDEEARSEIEDLNTSGSEIERGHHKKKKVHKEIKKLVIKVIVAIFLVMQKIKWALLMIQTILLNNFIIVATLFVFSKTIKIWHELKHHKPHVEKQVVVYDNHHQHYDTGDHSEVDDGHGHGNGWGWWGRSFPVQTEATPTEVEYDNSNDYYSSSRVIRSTEPYYEPRSTKRRRRDTKRRTK